MLACTKSIRFTLQVCKVQSQTTDNLFKWFSKRVSDGVTLDGECRHIGEKVLAEKNTLEYFLFERYSLYTELNGKLHMAYTLHEPWVF
ncbi:MAG: hypothetical protein CM15mP1_0900 [Methanobacteriota archaeon]|nr:MAG: hypothetical protein CM15mP1_0900 [Euryarchaeota archaeon]